MYHSARWGGWQYKLAARDDADHTMTFQCNILANTSTKNQQGQHAGYEVIAEGVPCPKTGGAHAIVQGGWQEARGGEIGAQYTLPSMNNSYFVENIKEELDTPGEWFVELAQSGGAATLYMIPPATSGGADGGGGGSAAAGASSADDPGLSALGSLTLVGTLEPRVVQYTGTSGKPVMNMQLVNVTIAHSAYTFMHPYETSSGGDWSIHRGGAIFVEGAQNVSISGCSFDQLDGNALFLSRFVRDCVVRDNDFSKIGDSGILVVGASGEHRTNNKDNREYPARNLIEGNHIDTVGVWCKQSAAYFKSITRDNILRNNVLHDGPRSGVNFNDG
jgi:hypothetical protein